MEDPGKIMVSLVSGRLGANGGELDGAQQLERMLTLTEVENWWFTAADFILAVKTIPLSVLNSF